MSNFNVTVESIQNSQLARQDNYLGKGYGYGRLGLDKIFVVVMIRNIDGSSTLVPSPP